MKQEKVIQLDPKKVHVSKLNTRQPTAKDVEELARSIIATGQISPAIVRPHPSKGDGHYELAAGARRRAAAVAAKVQLLCIVRDIPDEEFEDMILTDNLQRVDPDPMQEAILIERRIADGAEPSEIAARYGKSETWLKRRMKLTGLTEKARTAWAPGFAFSHFTTEMMEFVGTMPAEQQDDMADDPYNTRDVGTLDELLENLRHRAPELAGTDWLHDPATFIQGCGPGCATDTCASLFPDPDHPQGQCLNSECFEKRKGLFCDLRMENLLDGKPIGDFILFRSDGYNSQHTFKDQTLRVLNEWQFKEKFTTAKKAGPDTVAGIDLADPTTPIIVHLKRKAAKGKDGAAPQNESREDKLTGKRLSLLNEKLVEHLRSAPLPAAPPILNIVAAFGLNYARRNNWSEDSQKEVWDNLDFADAEDLWASVTPILRSRLQFQTNRDLLKPHLRDEMERVAKLTGFDRDAAWVKICTEEATIPKSWGPGLNPFTLKALHPDEPPAKKAAKKAGKKIAAATV